MTGALLHGALVRLAAINVDTDVETIVGWSRDPEYLHLLNTGASRPWSVQGTKADLAEMLGADKPNEQDFLFNIRTLADDQLIGFVDLEINNWAQRDAWIAIGIGPRALWGQGYGTDAMQVLMRFAFTELNLARLTLNVFGYNERAQRSYLKAGFQVEGRQRDRLRRGSQRYDLIFMGILRDEWQSREGFSPADQTAQPGGSV